MRRDNTKDKSEVLKLIANGKPYSKTVGQGPAKWLVGDIVIHVRQSNSPSPDGTSFAFNINPNTLSADYELWICGSPAIYYLVPIHIIKEMYNAEGAYQDSTHKNIRIVNIDTQHHAVRYAKGGEQLSISPYFCSKL